MLSLIQFVEFVVLEGHLRGDFQLAVGYSGLGLRREVLDGDHGFGVDFWQQIKSYFLNYVDYT